MRSALGIGTFWLTLSVLVAPAAGAGHLSAGSSPRSDPQHPTDFLATARVQSASGWDSERVRALIRRAVVRRAEWTDVEALQDYQARARGHIYFLFDLGRNTPRHLVKADQLALNLFWRAPGLTRQVIVGRREKKVLPTRIEYHIDHLTVVMDNFDDRIRLGEGSEVRDVLHPAAPTAPEFYEYRLADSLTLVLPDREVRVYRVDVRPREAGAPGIVGALFLDRATADIVRMEFTFTASAYLDPQLDYINVRLENALWDGRYWLPYRQGLELRREVRALDFPAGGIIRAEFRIHGYRFDTGFPPDLVEGPSITYLPARVRRNHPFDQGLYDALDPEIAVSPPSMERVRREATRIVQEGYLRRAGKIRLAVPGISSLVRFRRAEGVYLGAAIRQELPGGGSLRLLGGRAWGADRWQARGNLEWPAGTDLRIAVSGFHNRPDDATPWPASSGLLSTLASVVDGEDYRETFWSSGGSLKVHHAVEPLDLRFGGGWADWESAELEADDLIDRGYRPVRQLDAGEVAWLELGLSRSPPGAVEAVGGSSWEARIEGATSTVLGDFDYLRLLARAERYWPIETVDGGVRLYGQLGGLAGGRPPAQRLLPVGGRGTVRGYPFHGFVGDLYGTFGAELDREVWTPFLTVAAFAEIGWVGLEGGSSARRALEVWNAVGPTAGPSRGALVGLGAGVGLLFDILRVELARGTSEGGIWELIVRSSPRFWGWL